MSLKSKPVSSFLYHQTLVDLSLSLNAKNRIYIGVFINSLRFLTKDVIISHSNNDNVHVCTITTRTKMAEISRQSMNSIIYFHRFSNIIRHCLSAKTEKFIFARTKRKKDCLSMAERIRTAYPTISSCQRSQSCRDRVTRKYETKKNLLKCQIFSFRSNR